MGSETTSSQFPRDFLFLKIFQTFRMAIQPSKLIIAFLAITIICLAGWIMDLSKTVTATSSHAGGKITELQIYMTAPVRLKSYIEDHRDGGERTGVFSTLWNFAGEKFHGTLNCLFAFNLPGVAENIAEYFKAVGWALKYHTIYCIIFGAIKLVVITLAGGAICRAAALQFAQGEKPGLTESLRFSRKRFISLFTAPLAPVCIIIAAGLFILLLGLIGNIPWVGELIVGISMPLALTAALLITIILIGAVAGFNLMFPAVAYDGSDCFDVISRSFSYVYARPWRMGFYTATAAIYGAICYTFVRFFAFLLLWLTHLFLQFGFRVNNSTNQVNKLTAIWPGPSFTNLFGPSGLSTAAWSESAAAFLIRLSLLIVIGLVVSFVISFYFSANTIIYSLMRNSVDNTALEDIFLFDEAATKTEPADNENKPEQAQPQQDAEAKTEPSS